MGSGRVTSSDSLLSADGKSKDNSSADFRYGKTFEEQCSYYMSIGMSYNDYWHGDCWMAKYYREAYRKKLEQRNNDMWLQGLYIYEAICNASPILNPMSKKHEPIPYRESPIPITEAQSMKQKKEAEKKQMEHDKEIMKQRMIAINERLKGKEVDNGRRTD